ncbi:hypothetical protein PAPYR_10466 [Paratrimastix pyriformis]|uniref:Non-specific serine/threonine protein kinase n=1 Tax=Paratrimastix pyriformis TaxID=342808 RepID=A0ABQ8UD23_9EUKA|nr:hypothetical protein PAPYR_10466 [Paratrimastix pyriformis]
MSSALLSQFPSAPNQAAVLRQIQAALAGPEGASFFDPALQFFVPHLVNEANPKIIQPLFTLFTDLKLAQQMPQYAQQTFVQRLLQFMEHDAHLFSERSFTSADCQRWGTIFFTIAQYESLRPLLEPLSTSLMDLFARMLAFHLPAKGETLIPGSTIHSLEVITRSLLPCVRILYSAPGGLATLRLMAPMPQWMWKDTVAPAEGQKGIAKLIGVLAALIRQPELGRNMLGSSCIALIFLLAQQLAACQLPDAAIPLVLGRLVDGTLPDPPQGWGWVDMPHIAPLTMTCLCHGILQGAHHLPAVAAPDTTFLRTAVLPCLLRLMRATSNLDIPTRLYAIDVLAEALCDLTRRAAEGGVSFPADGLSALLEEALAVLDDSTPIVSSKAPQLMRAVIGLVQAILPGPTFASWLNAVAARALATLDAHRKSRYELLAVLMPYLGAAEVLKLLAGEQVQEQEGQQEGRLAAGAIRNLLALIRSKFTQIKHSNLVLTVKFLPVTQETRVQSPALADAVVRPPCLGLAHALIASLQGHPQFAGHPEAWLRWWAEPLAYTLLYADCLATGTAPASLLGPGAAPLPGVSAEKAEYLDGALVTYALPDLMPLHPQAVPVLMACVQGVETDVRRLPLARMRALVAVLKSARMLGLLPADLDMTPEGPPSPVLTNLLTRALASSCDPLRLGAFELLVSTLRSVQLPGPTERDLFLRFCRYALKTTSPAVRQGLAVMARRFCLRLRDGTHAMVSAMLKESRRQKVKVATSDLGALVDGVVPWYREYVRGWFMWLVAQLYPPSPFQRRIIALEMLRIFVEVFCWGMSPGAPLPTHPPAPEAVTTAGGTPLATWGLVGSWLAVPADLVAILLHHVTNAWDTNRLLARDVLMKLLALPLVEAEPKAVAAGATPEETPNESAEHQLTPKWKKGPWLPATILDQMLRFRKPEVRRRQELRHLPFSDPDITFGPVPATWLRWAVFLCTGGEVADADPGAALVELLCDHFDPQATNLLPVLWSILTRLTCLPAPADLPGCPIPPAHLDWLLPHRPALGQGYGIMLALRTIMPKCPPEVLRDYVPQMMVQMQGIMALALPQITNTSMGGLASHLIVPPMAAAAAAGGLQGELRPMPTLSSFDTEGAHSGIALGAWIFVKEACVLMGLCSELTLTRLLAAPAPASPAAGAGAGATEGRGPVAAPCFSQHCGTRNAGQAGKRECRAGWQEYPTPHRKREGPPHRAQDSAKTRVATLYANPTAGGPGGAADPALVEVALGTAQTSAMLMMRALLSTRHNGTIEKISLALHSLSQCLMQHPDARLRNLPAAWLDTLLARSLQTTAATTPAATTTTTDLRLWDGAVAAVPAELPAKISPLRRSSGLPYTVAAILCAETRTQSLFARTADRLLATILAAPDTDPHAQSPVPAAAAEGETLPWWEPAVHSLWMLCVSMPHSSKMFTCSFLSPPLCDGEIPQNLMCHLVHERHSLLFLRPSCHLCAALNLMSLNLMCHLVHERRLIARAGPYIGRFLQATIARLGSDCWPLRNAATFSFVVSLDRMVGAKRTGLDQSSLNTRTAHALFTQCPDLGPYLLRSIFAPWAAKAGWPACLYGPALAERGFVLLAHLTPGSGSSADGPVAALVDELVEVIVRCGQEMPDWHMRTLASRALASLVRQDAVPALVQRLAQPTTSATAMHGRLAQIFALAEANGPLVAQAVGQFETIARFCLGVLAAPGVVPGPLHLLAARILALHGGLVGAGAVDRTLVDATLRLFFALVIAASSRVQALIDTALLATSTRATHWDIMAPQACGAAASTALQWLLAAPLGPRMPLLERLIGAITRSPFYEVPRALLKELRRQVRGEGRMCTEPGCCCGTPRAHRLQLLAQILTRAGTFPALVAASSQPNPPHPSVLRRALFLASEISAALDDLPTTSGIGCLGGGPRPDVVSWVREYFPALLKISVGGGVAAGEGEVTKDSGAGGMQVEEADDDEENAMAKEEEAVVEEDEVAEEEATSGEGATSHGKQLSQATARVLGTALHQMLSSPTDRVRPELAESIRQWVALVRAMASPEKPTTIRVAALRAIAASRLLCPDQGLATPLPSDQRAVVEPYVLQLWEPVLEALHSGSNPARDDFLFPFYSLRGLCERNSVPRLSLPPMFGSFSLVVRTSDFDSDNPGDDTMKAGTASLPPGASHLCVSLALHRAYDHLLAQCGHLPALCALLCARLRPASDAVPSGPVGRIDCSYTAADPFEELAHTARALREWIRGHPAEASTRAELRDALTRARALLSRLCVATSTTSSTQLLLGTTHDSPGFLDVARSLYLMWAAAEVAVGGDDGGLTDVWTAPEVHPLLAGLRAGMGLGGRGAALGVVDPMFIVEAPAPGAVEAP